MRPDRRPAYSRSMTATTMREAVTEGVATKGDIARLETRIAELKVTMLLAMVALAGVIVAAITLLP